MVDSCCVEGCDGAPKDEITFFKLPKTRQQRRRWLTAADGKIADDGDAICSLHFTRDDYVTVAGEKRLTEKAVPSIFHVINSKPKSESPVIEVDRNEKDTNTDADVDKSDETYENVNKGDKEEENVNNKIDEDIIENEIDEEVDKNDIEGDRIDNNGTATNDSADMNGIEGAIENMECNDSPAWDVSLCHNGDLCQVTIDEDMHENCIVSNPDLPLEDKSTDDPIAPEDLRDHDLEDIIAHYQIEQNVKLKQIHVPNILNDKPPVDKPPEPVQNKKDSTTQENEKEKENTIGPVKALERDKDRESSVEFDYEWNFNRGPLQKSTEKPVFIEVDVEKDKASEQDGNQDCLMLLESVQCDIDPTSLMLSDNEDIVEVGDEVILVAAKKEDPISLLTSSDESDVILEEPDIDLIEVSSDDEDDVPLGKLFQKDPKQLAKETALKSILFNQKDFYCMQCHFTSVNSADYRRHVQTHSKTIQICEVCNYTTASKLQFSKHKRKHREEKRFHCHLCGYKAKHNMSLLYHMKSHNRRSITAINLIKCDHCPYTAYNTLKMSRHLKMCKANKRFKCKKCKYSTESLAGLKRHKKKCASDTDDEYTP